MTPSLPALAGTGFASASIVAGIGGQRLEKLVFAVVGFAIGISPLLWMFAPLAIIGCTVLFFFLPWEAKMLFPIWSAIGLVFYFAYGYRHSHVARGVTEVPELAPDAPPGPIAD